MIIRKPNEFQKLYIPYLGFAEKISSASEIKSKLPDKQLCYNEIDFNSSMQWTTNFTKFAHYWCHCCCELF